MLVEVVLFTGAATAALVYLARSSAAGTARTRSELNSFSRDLSRARETPGEHHLSANIWRVAIDCHVHTSDRATVTLTLEHKAALTRPFLIEHTSSPPRTTRLDLGAPEFERHFHVAGHPELIFSSLGASARSALLEFARHHTQDLQTFTADERALRATLSLPRSALEFARISRAANALSAIGRALFGHGKPSAFDRLVQSAAHDHATAFREQCALLLLENYPDRRDALWRHDEPGVQILGFLLAPDAAPRTTDTIALLKENALNHPVEPIKSRAMNALITTLGADALHDEDLPLSIKLELLTRALDLTTKETTTIITEFMDGALPAERATILLRLARSGWSGLDELITARSRDEALSPAEVNALFDAATLAPTLDPRALAMRLLDHRSSSTRGRAAHYLGDHGGAETLSLLREVLRAESSTSTRVLITTAIEDIERALIAEHTWPNDLAPHQDDE